MLIIILLLLVIDPIFSLLNLLEFIEIKNENWQNFCKDQKSDKKSGEDDESIK